MKKLFLAMALCAFGTPAFAASSIHAPVHYGNFYLGAGYGGVLPNESKISFSGAITGSGDLEYKTSAMFTGVAGVYFTDYLAVEAELDYSEVEYNGVSGTLTGGILGTGTGTLSIDGQDTYVLGMANALLSPFGRSGFSPYLGAGAGVAHAESNLDNLHFDGSSAVVNAKQSKTSLALAGIAGLDYVLGRQLSIGARYRYLWIDSADTSAGGGVTTNFEDFKTHVLSAQVTYRF
jgi:opacity protein-like surface antigen